MASRGLVCRRRLRVGPELIVNALHQLPARRKAPGELREGLSCSYLPRKVRIGARLAVGVAKLLIPGEEPQPIASDRAAEAGREVAVRVSFIAALQLPGGVRTRGCTGWLVSAAGCQ